MEFKDMVIAAAKAVIEQGKASVTRDENGGIIGCCYRGPDGLKCAVGHLISDEAMVFIREGDSAVHAISNIEEAGLRLIGAQKRLTLSQLNILSSLQRAHDAAARISTSNGTPFVEVFKEQLRNRPLAAEAPYLQELTK